MNEPRVIVSVIDTLTGEEYTGTIQEICKRINMCPKTIREASKNHTLLDKRYFIRAKDVVYKITMPYGKVKWAKNVQELEEIFGYANATIFKELEKSGNGTAFGCKIERTTR